MQKYKICPSCQSKNEPTLLECLYCEADLTRVKVTDEETEKMLEENATVTAFYNKSFEAPEARVLIVDDDDLNLIITTKLLQDTKMTIDTASSGEECLRKTMRRYYNLIFVRSV